MTSDADKLFDAIDALQVKLRGLREMRNDLLEQASRLDFEIGEVRMRLMKSYDAFQRLDNASIQSVAGPVPSAAVDPQAHTSPVSPGGGFSLIAMTDRGATALESIQARLPHGDGGI